MEFTDKPEGGRVKALLAGIVLPGIFILWAVKLWQAESLMMGKRSRLVLEGFAADAVSLFVLTFGLAIHFHSFWGLSPRFFVVSMIGKAVCIVIMLAATVYVSWDMLLRVF